MAEEDIVAAKASRAEAHANLVEAAKLVVGQEVPPVEEVVPEGVDAALLLPAAKQELKRTIRTISSC